MSTLKYGDAAARLVSRRIAEPLATLAALKAVDNRSDGQKFLNTGDGSAWRFSLASALTGDDLLVVTPTNGSGRWLRECGGVKIVIPITFATADAAILLTMPTGSELHLHELYWDVTADWTGGASSTIGVSSSNKTSLTTKGDLLGGSAGSLAAALTLAGAPNFGTIGAGYDTLAKRRVIFKATETIRHDRITSAFVAGTGNLVLLGNLAKNAGA